MSDREADDELFALLHEAFETDEVRHRDQGGRGFDYIKVESIENRLDDTFGPANWEDSYRIIDEITAECTLTVTLPGDRRVSKVGVGERKGAEAKPGDAGRPWRAAYSYALKSAAKKFGVGRGLNRGGYPRFVQPALDRITARSKPARPAAAKPVISIPPPAPADEPPPPAAEPTPRAPAERTHVNVRPHADPPRTGRAMFAWTKEQEQLHEVPLLRFMNDWAKGQGYPGRMVDWSPDQAERGYSVAVRKLAAIHGEIPEEALSN